MSTDVLHGEFVDYYDLLQVSIDTPTQEVRKSYLRLAKTAHPDMGGSTEKMQLLNQAYDTLSNYFSRTAYNKLYKLHNDPDSDLDLREDVRRRAGSPVSSQYADDYVNNAYAEYYNSPEGRAARANPISKILYGIFGVSAVAIIAIVVVLAGVSYLGAFDFGHDTPNPDTVSAASTPSTADNGQLRQDSSIVTPDETTNTNQPAAAEQASPTTTSDPLNAANTTDPTSTDTTQTTTTPQRKKQLQEILRYQAR